VVTQQLWDRWDVEVTRDSHREYAELCQRWEPDAFVQNGFVRWTTNPECAEALEQARERLKGWGVRVEEPSTDDLARWVPAGRFDDVRAALVSPHDACVRPSSVTTIYAEGARSQGAVFDFGVPLESLTPNQGGWSLSTATRLVHTSRLVVAAGAWSKELLRRIGHPLPLTPYRTQAALLAPGKAPEPFPTVHDLDTDVYLRPEGPGRILGGDGTESHESDPERFVTGGDAEFLAHLAESLGARFPGWADSTVVGSWAGVCTATPDRHPIVGDVVGAPQLTVMTGFNGFGVMRAGGVARRLADLLTDEATAEDARALLGPAWAGRYTGPGEPFPPRPGFTLEPGDRPRW
jgi:sarcosine oxidase, subunit beta